MSFSNADAWPFSKNTKGGSMLNAHLQETALIRFLDGDKRVQKKVLAHLKVCRECRFRLQSIRRFKVVMNDLLNDTDNAEEIEEICRQIESDQQVVESAMQLMKQ